LFKWFGFDNPQYARQRLDALAPQEVLGGFGNPPRTPPEGLAFAMLGADRLSLYLGCPVFCGVRLDVDAEVAVFASLPD
jgi:hypothetical protein